jgi:hypothetical protein
VLKPLYLDTARLGLMSPRACRASVDFARFASEQGCSLYFSKFLAGGSSAWPESLNQQYPGLESWRGISTLTQRLREIAGAAPESEVVLAARSAELMRLATRLLIGPCRNVLLTDLSWPTYEKIFETQRRGSASRRTRLALRHRILRDRISATELVDRIAEEFVQHGCDGLFLPLVDNLGVQLPIRDIVERLRRLAELRFVVVDGAQSIGHVPLGLADGYCDLFLAGCHKWLRAFSPLGLAFFGNPGSESYIRDSLSRWLDAGEIDDPMLSFSRELLEGKSMPFGETVQVAPLLTANGAALDALDRGLPDDGPHAGNAIIDVAEANGWRSVAPHRELASRILLFEPAHPHRGRFAHEHAHERVREQFLTDGIALSSYEGNNGSPLIRLSLPDAKLFPGDLERLATAFRRTASPCDRSRFD